MCKGKVKKGMLFNCMISPYMLKHNKIYIWSARPVLKRKFPPVFRFYASLPRASLLQVNASTGAKQLRQFFIFRVAGCTTRSL